MARSWQDAEPLISVVIPTRNRASVLGQCLDALFDQSEPPFEIIVVDSSTDDATEQLLARYQESVTYLRIPAAEGSAPHQKNLGARQAKGSIVAFIDDDSIVQPGWLAEIASCYDDPRVGAVGGMVLSAECPQAKPAGAGPVGQLHPIAFELLGGLAVDTQGLVEVQWLSGCNMSVRRDVFQRIGGFDTRYAGDFSWEEPDLCARVQRKGFKVLYNPRAKVYHLLAPRSRVDRQTDEPGYHWKRNRMYFFLKYAGLRRIFWRLFVKEPYWALRSVGGWRTLTRDVRPRVLGVWTYVRYILEGRRYPLSSP